MAKVKKFYGGQLHGSLYFLYEPLSEWLYKNNNIKVISVLHDGDTLLVVYEES